MLIGEKIKNIAGAKAVSVQELARRIGRTRQGIYDIYNSRVSVSVDQLVKISEALGEPILNFFIDDPDSYYDIIPQVIPMREILKHIQHVNEHATRGEGMVNLRIFRTRDGMYILESEFRKLNEELSDEDKAKYSIQIKESIKACSK